MMSTLDRTSRSWGSLPSGVMADRLLRALNSSTFSSSSTSKPSSYEASYDDEWTSFRRKRWDEEMGFTFKDVFMLNNVTGDIHAIAPSSSRSHFPSPTSMVIGNVSTTSAMDVFVRGLAEQRPLV